jgi:multidrug transporter EmrE-like cation transporter
MLVISEAVNALQGLGIVLVIAAVLMLRLTQKDEEEIVESPPAR